MTGMKSREFLLSYQATCKFITEFDDHPSALFFSLVFSDHLSPPCHPIFFYFLCPSCRLGLHVKGLQWRLKPFRVKQLWNKHTFLGYYWHLSEVFDVRLSQSLSSICRLPPRKGWEGSWGGRKERRGEENPHPATTQSFGFCSALMLTSLILLVILKFGGGVGRTAWEPLSLWALRSCLMRTLEWTPLFPSPPKNNNRLG